MTLAAPPRRARRLLANIGAVALTRTAAAVVSFLALPLIIRAAGAEAYGLYAVLATITGYFGLLDFGMAAALPKYVAEYHGRGDRARVSRIIATVFTWYLAIGIAVSLGLLLLRRATPWMFGLDATLGPMADRLFLVAAVAAIALWPTTTFRLALEGLQQFRTTAAIGGATQMAGLALGLVLLARGAGMPTYLAVTSVASLAANLAFYVMLRRTYPDLALRPRLRDRETFRLVSGFSLWVFLGSIASTLVFQLDNILVGAFVSLSAVTVYTVAFALLAGVKLVDNVIAGPPWVAAAEMEGRSDVEGQRRLLRRGTRFIACLFLPAIAILIVFTERVVAAWMGPGFEASVLPARILLAGWMIPALWETGVGVATAKGAVRTLTMIGLVNGGLNLLISLVLVRPLGIVGVALGTSLPFIIVAPLLWRIIIRTVDVRFGELALDVLRPALGPITAGLVVAASLDAAAPAVGLVGVGAMMALAYGTALIVAWITALTPEDRALISMPRVGRTPRGA